MDNVPVSDAGVSYAEKSGRTGESSVSAISWAAIAGGAVAASAAALLLLTLGSGLGLATVSPWPNAGASAAAFAISAGIWLIVAQWVSSGLGGYVTGRLRTKWVGVHTHEVFFRDTAHGFLTWAVASVIGAVILASAASSVVSAGTRAAATVAAGAAPLMQARAYDVDSLFRGEKADMAASGTETRAEATRILAVGMGKGEVASGDRTYLAQTVAARTGLAPADAQKRVDDVIAQEKAAETGVRQAADVARKHASAVAIFTALSMLIGAFIASAAAAYGGSVRDEHA